MKFNKYYKPPYRVKEGGETLEFMKNNLGDYNASDMDVLEIGPKHGNHTRFIDAHNPKSLTCIELAIKTKEADALAKSIKNKDVFKIEIGDFLHTHIEQSYDLIIFAGVLYHNIDQIQMLKRLWELANKDCIMFFESSTTRSKDIQDKNIIEIHWPETYRNTTTIRMLPSQNACISMLEMTGWKCVVIDKSNTERINIMCKKTNVPLTAYKTL